MSPSPFLVYGLGAEMVYVLAQRLCSQDVPARRAAAAIDKIISMLVDWDLLSLLLKPQETFSHKRVKNIMEDIAQCSMMRLDPVSMDKLWDLITMVLKWQIALCPSSSHVSRLTETHLREIEKYVSTPTTLEKLHRVQDCVSTLKDSLSVDESERLRWYLTEWLKPFNIKVSLLIKSGLQTADGSFVENPNNDEVLMNLGKSIYLTPENDKLALAIKEKKYKEVNALPNDLLGNNVDYQRDGFKFTALKSRENNNDNEFKEIDVKRDNSNLQEIYDEFRVTDNNLDNNEYDFINILATN